MYKNLLAYPTVEAIDLMVDFPSKKYICKKERFSAKIISLVEKRRQKKILTIVFFFQTIKKVPLF
jgi:hypothetical protein